MRKVKAVIVYLLSLLLIVALSATEARSFDPEAISQVSKGIAEWKLMNQDKSETQAEPGVYVSSALSGMVERGSSEGVGVIKGLSGLIEMNQLPDPILWNDASKLNTLYNGNIEIIIDRTLDRPGYTHTTFQRSGNQTWGKSIISINPDKFKEWRTDLGGVLAHEMRHANGHFYQAKLNLSQYGPIEVSRTSLHLQETKVLSGKASYIPPTEWHAIGADNNYRATLQAKFDQESRVARSIGIKNYDPLKTSKISEYQALRNIPEIKGNSITPIKTNYPPPDKFFSIKNPLDAYKPPPMPKLPTYTSPTLPKVPTYTPPRMPSSSIGRRY